MRASIVRRLVAADPAANAYLADLTAGRRRLLRARRWSAPAPNCWWPAAATRVVVPAVRGLGAAAADPDADRASGDALAESAKNRHEHELVVDAMRKALDPLCVDLQIAADTAAEPHRSGLAPVHTHQRAVA